MKTPPSAGATSAAHADSSVSNGESAYYRAAYDSAGAHFHVALNRARELRDSALEGRALTWLGLTAYRQGDLVQARTLGEQALALKMRAGLSADLFRSYNALGLVAKDEGRLDDALLLYAKGAAAARANRDETGVASSANNQSLVYAAQGKFAQAREGLVQARDTYRRLGDEMREGRALNNLGMLDVQMGDPRSAIALLARARVLFRSTGDRNGEQNALGQLGTAYDALGETSLALASLDSALRLSRQHGLRQEEADNIEVIAGLHRQAGDLPRALALYEQANGINGELGQTLEQGTNLRNAAEIRAALGRPDLARDNAMEALRLHRKAGVPFDELRDRLLLADLSASAAEPNAVRDDHLRAAERLSSALDARIARVEVALTTAAVIDRAGDSRRVLRALDRARKDLSLGGFGGEWQAAALRARAYARLSLLDSAAAAGREAVAAAERVRGNFGSAFLRSSFAADKATLYGDLVETLVRLNRISEAFEVADGARSHAVLEHLTAMSNALPSGAMLRSLSEGEAVLRKIDTLVSRLDVLEETPPAERDARARRQVRALAADLADARSAYETLMAQAADRDATGTALLGGRKISADEVQRWLRSDEAMLEYLVTPARLVVFVVTRANVRSLVAEIPREDLARRVRLARDLVADVRSSAAAHSEVLTALHKILVAPVEQAGMLRGVRRVIVVPHSVLAYLPFSALKREGTGRHLMEDYSLLHLPSAAALGVLRTASSAEAPTARASQATAFVPFPRALPGSVREARAFRRAVGGAQTEQGRHATEARLRRALSGGGIVHVATHGVMNPGNPMFSRIELAAGGGGPNDDGRLEVHELLTVRLAAPLVFLSGCETGVGASWSTAFARGEDYATLAQAFLYAGARTVTATLWRIGDDGAAALAERFYAKLQTMAPAEALAAAQRDLLRGSRFSGPFYWAGYQVIGESEPVPGLHRSPSLSVQR